MKMVREFPVTASPLLQNTKIPINGCTQCSMTNLSPGLPTSDRCSIPSLDTDMRPIQTAKAASQHSLCQQLSTRAAQDALLGLPTHLQPVENAVVLKRSVPGAPTPKHCRSSSAPRALSQKEKQQLPSTTSILPTSLGPLLCSASPKVAQKEIYHKNHIYPFHNNTEQEISHGLIKHTGEKKASKKLLKYHLIKMKASTKVTAAHPRCTAGPSP